MWLSQHNLGERPAYTWAEAVQRWYAEADGRGKEHDRDRLKWFAQYLDTTPIASIDRDLIEQELRTLRRGESSPSTANRYMALLRMILRKAHREWDWIDKAPVVPMYRLEASEPRYLTRGQWTKLKKKLPLHLAVVADFSVETGLRMRNVTGLLWSQVDLRRKLVVIPASRAKAGETIAVPLSVGAVQILKAQAGRHMTHVFTHRKGPNGRYLTFEDANGAVFKAAAAAAGVPCGYAGTICGTRGPAGTSRLGRRFTSCRFSAGGSLRRWCSGYAHLSTEHLRAFTEHKKGIPRKRA